MPFSSISQNRHQPASEYIVLSLLLFRNNSAHLRSNLEVLVRSLLTACVLLVPLRTQQQQPPEQKLFLTPSMTSEQAGRKFTALVGAVVEAQVEL
jgi:hypothetical protein